MFSQILKQWVIITSKHGIYELPHELPNNLRLRKIGNIRKVSKLHRIIALCPVSLPKTKILLILTLEKQKLIFSRCTLFHLKTRVSLEYFVNHCLWKLFFYSNLSQNLSNLFFFYFFGNTKVFHAVVWANIKETKGQKKSPNLPYLLAFFLIFSLRLKFGIKRISSFLSRVF